jgi:hypothetical protein
VHIIGAAELPHHHLNQEMNAVNNSMDGGTKALDLGIETLLPAVTHTQVK